MKPSRSRTIILSLILAATLGLAQEKPMRIGPNVQQANRLTEVLPVYPPEAKQNGIQGMVRLEITIDKDGRVSELKALSGPAELIQSAIDAVKQWTYRPTRLNGEPVSVMTTVDVNYSLAQ
jgi:protein TonB